MPESGSSIFTDADRYQANLQDILNLLVLRPRDFHARLSWADLTHLSLLRACESSARLGYLTLTPDLISVTFPTREDAVLLYAGATLRFGDIMFHARGERLHQRTTAGCDWASIALTPVSLMTFGRTLAGQELAAPTVGRIVRPRRADGRRLLRLHAQVGRVVETNLDCILNKEVARALEQDLILALINCLADGTVREVSTTSRQNADILRSFEGLLTEQPHRLLRSQDICASLGVSENAFRASCNLGLGMSASRYQRLRRLKSLHAELLHAGNASARNIEEALAQYSFTGLNQFVTEYWRYYGEMPPIPPRGSADQ